MSILLAEIGLMCLPNQWLLRAATFWHTLAALPPGSLYKEMALDACACVSSMSRAIRGRGYDLCIRQDDMDHIDSRSCLPTSRSTGMLSGITWTFALGPVLLRTHACAHTRTGLLGLQVAMLGHFWTCPFPCAACSAYCASEWAATSCPGTLDAGFMCQD